MYKFSLKNTQTPKAFGAPAFCEDASRQKHLKDFCFACPIFNYCRRKELCTYLEENGFIVTHNFICALETLYLQAHYFTCNALPNEYLSAEKTFYTLLKRFETMLRECLKQVKSECYEKHDIYQWQMVKLFVSEELESAGFDLNECAALFGND